jgi:hypothetical protein
MNHKNIVYEGFSIEWLDKQIQLDLKAFVHHSEDNHQVHVLSMGHETRGFRGRRWKSC